MEMQEQQRLDRLGDVVCGGSFTPATRSRDVEHQVSSRHKFHHKEEPGVRLTRHVQFLRASHAGVSVYTLLGSIVARVTDYAEG